MHQPKQPPARNSPACVLAPEPATVLVVDDDPKNRALVLGYLGSSYRVIEAADGEAALDVVGRQTIDVVLLDVMMPGMSGFEVCRRLKAAPRGTLLPVLLLTALHEQDDRNQGLEAGADDFLTKPVDRRELRLRVATFLRLRRQEALIQRQLEELRRLDALKDDLVSLMVHDLRNPLAGVLGFLHVVRDAVADEEIREDLAVAQAAGEKMRLALEDLLRVRQLETGVLEVHVERANVAAVARDAVASVEGVAKERGVAVVQLARDEPEIQLDRDLVRRAIENLVVNAVTHSRRGGKVDIEVRSAGGGVEIDVADRGPGIPDARKDHVFRKFGSVGTTSSGERRGFGLGLYLVHLVATAHGGEVLVLDRDGGGSLFRVVLPDRRGLLAAVASFKEETPT